VAVVASVLVVLTALTGCLASNPKPVAAVARGSQCPAEYPVRLALSTHAVMGVPPLSRLKVCATTRRRGPVLLMNEGDAAWATVAPGHEIHPVQGNAVATWLRSRTAVPTGMVFPGAAVVVDARPDEVTWQLSREWTVGWSSLAAGLYALPDSGRDSADQALAAGSPRGQALISCALTAYHLYLTSNGDPLPARDGFGSLELTWSATPSACGSDWQRADRLLARSGARPATWSLAVIRADAWVGGMHGALSWLDEGGPVMIGISTTG
jgi:hypothetical protein